MNDPVFREAEPVDLGAIVAVFLECWRVNYATVLPPDLLGSMDEDAARDLWSAALERPGVVILVEVDDRVAGLTRYSHAEGEPGHIASLYVSPRSQGLGLGGRLLDAAESGLRVTGAGSATLWVFADNASSIGFYGARGWSADGATRVEERFGVPEIRLTKALG